MIVARDPHFRWDLFLPETPFVSNINPYHVCSNNQRSVELPIRGRILPQIPAFKNTKLSISIVERK